MKKVTLIMITLIISMSLANADETTSSTSTGTTSTWTTTTVETEDSNLSDKQEEFKKIREEERARIEANRERMKDNRVEFKWERGTWVLVKINLTDDQKAKIKVIMDAHKVSADAVRASVASWSLTKEEWFKKLEELRISTNESLKAIVWDNVEAMRMLELKKDMLDKNMEIRKENGVIRQDFRQVRQDLKVKYKEKFVKALGTKLDKLSEEKLEKVLAKIETAIELTNANEKLSQTNKDKILAQLDALKDIINEKLWVTDETTDLDVDALITE